MKKICRLQKMIILLCLVLLSCNPVARADFDSPVETYVLSGYEIFIGIDYRGTRYGTLFTGILKSQDNQNVGYWNVCIHHTWTENIEVCNRWNDIKYFCMTIHFTDGRHAGKTVILTMRDTISYPDVHWIGNYAGTPCEIGGFNCEACGIDTTMSACSEGDYADIAAIEEIRLSTGRKSTLKVKNARIRDGRLCHYFPYIPRVSGFLEWDLNE